MKNVMRFLGIIMFVIVIGFSMTACPPEGNNDNSSGVGLDSTPEFPAEVTGASTEQEAKDILKNFRDSHLGSIDFQAYALIEADMEAKIPGYGSKDEDIPDNYNYNSGNLTGDQIRVNATANLAMTMSNNVKKIFDIMNKEEPTQQDYLSLANLNLTTGDNMRQSATRTTTSTVTDTKTKTSKSGTTVKLVTGSFYTEGDSIINETKITKAGKIDTAQAAMSYKDENYQQAAFTIMQGTTGIRVVFEVKRKGSETIGPYDLSELMGSGIGSGGSGGGMGPVDGGDDPEPGDGGGGMGPVDGGDDPEPGDGGGFDDDDDYVDTAAYSGFFKAYGADSELLIDMPITDAASYKEARSQWTTYEIFYGIGGMKGMGASGGDPEWDY